MPARASKCRDFTQIAKAVVDAATSKGQVIQDGNASGTNPADQYVWGLMNVNQLVLRDYEFEGGAPRGRDYVQQDANWDTTAVVDSTGAVKYRYTYDPYGNVAVLQSNGTTYIGNYSIISSQTTGLRYLYQGGLMSLGGNYLFGARNYDPSLARWMEQDPSGYSSGTNLYQAFGSDPASHTDPSGEIALPTGGFGGVITPPIEYAPTNGGGGSVGAPPIEYGPIGGGSGGGIIAPIEYAPIEVGGGGGIGAPVEYGGSFGGIVTPFIVRAPGGTGGIASPPIAYGPTGGGGVVSPFDSGAANPADSGNNGGYGSSSGYGDWYKQQMESHGDSNPGDYPDSPDPNAGYNPGKITPPSWEHKVRLYSLAGAGLILAPWGVAPALICTGLGIIGVGIGEGDF